MRIVSPHHCFLETTESKQGRKGNLQASADMPAQGRRGFSSWNHYLLSCVALGKLPRLSEPLFSHL